MSTQMSVYLSQTEAAAHWGNKALVSFTEQGATVHLAEGYDLDAIQRAARKIVSQGITDTALDGQGWDVETIWAFFQGFREPKKNTNVTWQPLEEAHQAELEARIQATAFTCDIINKSAEEVAPRQLSISSFVLFHEHQECGSLVPDYPQQVFPDVRR